MSGRLSRPCLWTLPSSLKTLYMKDFDIEDKTQRRAAFQLITDAAHRADNVGVDEFTMEWFESMLLEFTKVAVMLHEVHDEQHQHDPERLLGLILVSGSHFERSANPCTGQLRVVTAAELCGRQTWRDLARLGTSIISAEVSQFTGCVFEVFVPCVERMLAMRDEGFLITSCVPMTGLLAGQSGLVDSYVLYKCLREAAVPTLYLVKGDTDDDKDKPTFTLRPLPSYLPCRCGIDGGRTQIIVRPLRRDEVVDFHTTVKDAAASGTGYGFDEIRGLSHFTRWYVNNMHNLVFQLAATEKQPHGEVSTSSVYSSCTPSKNYARRHDGSGDIIAYVNFGPPIYSRSREFSVMADANAVILPAFRGRRWFSELQEMYFGVAYDCGYRMIFSEAVINNTPMLRTARQLGGLCCGVMPHNVYVKGFGWMDGVYIKIALDERHSFQRKFLQSNL